MKRKFLFIFLLCFALYAICFAGNGVKAAEPTYSEENGYILNGSQKCFFANGTNVSIEERADGQSGATIFWEDGTKSVNVPSDINVFGGAHNDSTVYENTKITMNGGTVKNLFGGGLHESHVKTAEVILNAGTVTGSIAGGGANVFANSDYCANSNLPFANSLTRVENAIVTANNGNAALIYGGGEGNSYTSIANVNINGGNFDFVTAGGSNGYTGNANLKVTSGQINLLQSVNRGGLVSADMRVAGGTINKLYVGGEEGDTSVTGTIENVSLDITGGAIVTNLYIGTSGGQKIGTAGNNAKADVDIYKGATVNIASQNDFANIKVTNYVFVTINENRFEIEEGKTLADLAELENVKNIEGKEFVKFVVKGTDETFEESTVIDNNIELEAIYKDKEIKPVPTTETDKTPKTGIQDTRRTIPLAIVLVSLIILVTACAFSNKNR